MTQTDAELEKFAEIMSADIYMTEFDFKEEPMNGGVFCFARWNPYCCRHEWSSKQNVYVTDAKLFVLAGKWVRFQDSDLTHLQLCDE